MYFKKNLLIFETTCLLIHRCVKAKHLTRRLFSSSCWRSSISVDRMLFSRCCVFTLTFLYPSSSESESSNLFSWYLLLTDPKNDIQLGNQPFTTCTWNNTQTDPYIMVYANLLFVYINITCPKKSYMILRTRNDIALQQKDMSYIKHAAS